MISIILIYIVSKEILKIRIIILKFILFLVRFFIIYAITLSATKAIHLMDQITVTPMVIYYFTNSFTVFKQLLLIISQEDNLTFHSVKVLHFLITLQAMTIHILFLLRQEQVELLKPTNLLYYFIQYAIVSCSDAFHSITAAYYFMTTILLLLITITTVTTT